MSHCYSSMFLHFVWATKGRIPYFSQSGKKRLHAYLKSTIEKKEVELLAVSGMYDHVHILVKFPARYSASDFMRHVKATSSGFINRVVKAEEPFRWQEGYSLFSVSASHVNRIRKYIFNQEKHHESWNLGDECDFFSNF